VIKLVIFYFLFLEKLMIFYSGFPMTPHKPNLILCVAMVNYFAKSGENLFYFIFQTNIKIFHVVM
jgi:hypothetical protein